jgi:hypothetical protein
VVKSSCDTAFHHTGGFTLSETKITQCWLFPGLFRKAVLARFDEPHASSDGGAVLLKAADRRLDLTRSLAACLPDEREPAKVSHELLELFRQRVFGIACGYPDANDAARLGDDPIHKLLVGRDPVEGDPLASQPTLSRFENSLGPRELFRLGQGLAEAVIERHRRRLRGRAHRITIDLDTTEDPTHGTQQLSFFNGHYGSWCYLPLLGFLSFDDEPDQHLFTAVLRAGNAPDKLGVRAILWRVLLRLREAFPGARFRVRLDAGFACPEILDYLDSQPGVDYVVAMGRNPVLERRAQKLMRKARRLSAASGRTEHLYGECRYRARRWHRRRRVIFKAEVVRLPGREPRDNPRFVITNLKPASRWVYEKVYCRRGDIENRVKELQEGLQIDRTSCCRFWANQFRVLLTAAAYVLLQELRLCGAHTACGRAQVSTLREHLIKLGAHVIVSVRRIVVHLPESSPFRNAWSRVALGLGARAG